MYTTANIQTATNPMHVVPHHHGCKVSAYIGSAAVKETVFCNPSDKILNTILG